MGKYLPLLLLCVTACKSNAPKHPKEARVQTSFDESAAPAPASAGARQDAPVFAARQPPTVGGVTVYAPDGADYPAPSPKGDGRRASEVSFSAAGHTWKLAVFNPWSRGKPGGGQCGAAEEVYGRLYADGSKDAVAVLVFESCNVPEIVLDETRTTAALAAPKAGTEQISASYTSKVAPGGTPQKVLLLLRGTTLMIPWAVDGHDRWGTVDLSQTPPTLGTAAF